MASTYDPRNWYWSVTASSPETQVWSSADYGYVALANANYVAWLALGNTPTTIADESSLFTVFYEYNKGFFTSFFNTADFGAIGASDTFYTSWALEYKFSASAAGVTATIVPIYGAAVYTTVRWPGAIPSGFPIRFRNTGSTYSITISFSGQSFVIGPLDGVELTLESMTTANGTWGISHISGISSLGTGVATALGVNVGTAGAFVVNGGALGTPTSGNLTNCSQLGGTATNDNSAAGDVGEYVEGSLTFASRASATNGTTSDIVSISLTAGDWDVTGLAGIYGANTTKLRSFQGSTNSTATTIDATIENRGYIDFGTATCICDASFTNHVNVPRKRYSLSTTTTIYLNVIPIFTVSTAEYYGKITARRVR